MAAAVAVGAFVLSHRTDPAPVATTSPARVSPAPAASAAVAAATSTTAELAHDPSRVKILVLNGVDPHRTIASSAARTLASAGFGQASPNDAVGTAGVTAVYWTPSYEADANIVASALHLPSTSAQPLPQPNPPVLGAIPNGTNIVVVFGTDTISSG